VGSVALSKLSGFFDDARDVDKLEASRVEHDRGASELNASGTQLEDRSLGSTGMSRKRLGSTTKNKRLLASASAPNLPPKLYILLELHKNNDETLVQALCRVLS
jgi:hypothetical protein